MAVFESAVEQGGSAPRDEVDCTFAFGGTPARLANIRIERHIPLGALKVFHSCANVIWLLCRMIRRGMMWRRKGYALF